MMCPNMKPKIPIDTLHNHAEYPNIGLCAKLQLYTNNTKTGNIEYILQDVQKTK